MIVESSETMTMRSFHCAESAAAATKVWSPPRSVNRGGSVAI